MFETLNDRGLELSKADLIKNHIFGRAGDRLGEAQDRWAQMIGSLEAVANEEIAVTFIRHVWASKHGLTREKDLYGYIKDDVKNPQSAIAFVEGLSNDAVMYAALLNSDQPYWTTHTDLTKRLLKVFLDLHMQQNRPLLLAIMNKLKPAEVEKCFKLVVNCSVRFSITGNIGGGSIEQVYANVATQVTNGQFKTAKHLLTGLKIRVPNDAQFQRAFIEANVSQSSIARYYLRELENVANPKQEYSINTDKEVMTLEHILSEAPPSGASLDLELYQTLVHRLGNLALTDKKLNNDELRSKDFAQKKPLYAKSGLTLTSSISKTQGTQWWAKQIEARQIEMAKLALKAWPLKA